MSPFATNLFHASNPCEPKPPTFVISANNTLGIGKSCIVQAPWLRLFREFLRRSFGVTRVGALSGAVSFLVSYPQALVGLAFGPDGSSARVEHADTPSGFPPWRDGGALHLAVLMTRTGNAVQIVPPPVPLCSTLTSLSPSGDTTWWGARSEGGDLGAIGGEGWLGGVKESMELMSAVLKRELPATFVAKELLPSVSATFPQIALCN